MTITNGVAPGLVPAATPAAEAAALPANIFGDQPAADASCV